MFVCSAWLRAAERVYPHGEERQGAALCTAWSPLKAVGNGLLGFWVSKGPSKFTWCLPCPTQDVL